ncbi:unnamed protein product [Pseudo-nitzschia multistriata]|uniref:Uncharacterized protein n=1 Tax=Pseudo-nitzschia multistriata TaxID=183589 RepID=A0A448Z790_9STRA|nr:unnamed protein product [Pseudo-nitzschia multistriata]
MVKPAAIFVSFFALWFLSLQVASSRLVCPTNYWRVLRSIYGNTWLTTSPNLSLQCPACGVDYCMDYLSSGTSTLRCKCCILLFTVLA